MQFSITLSLWWFIPSVITALAVGWMAYWTYRDFSDGGWGTGLVTVMMATPALFVMALAWAIGAVLK